MTSPYTATFHYQIGSDGVWEWQMGVYTKNSTTHVPFFQLLVGDLTYNGIEGPVIGGFGTIYGDLLGSVYFQDILFLAAPFYFVLLIYMLFKNGNTGDWTLSSGLPPWCRKRVILRLQPRLRRIPRSPPRTKPRGRPQDPPDRPGPRLSSTARSATPSFTPARKRVGSAGQPFLLHPRARGAEPTQ